MDANFGQALAHRFQSLLRAYLAQLSCDLDCDTAIMARRLLSGASTGLWDLALAIALDSPAELDQFTDEQFLGWLVESALTG